MQTLGFANITVQNLFNDGCTQKIKKELVKVEDILNLNLSTEKATVTLSFTSANTLSTVLNLLEELGYPPIEG